MQYKIMSNGLFAVRIGRGENPIEMLADFAKTEKIGGAVSGIGTVYWAEIGYFDLNKNQYVHKRFDEEMEVLSFTGTITYKDDEPIVHIHTVLGNSEFGTIGGHLFAASVSATLEVIINPWQKNEIQRINDNNTGLALWKIE